MPVPERETALDKVPEEMVSVAEWSPVAVGV